MLSARIIGRKGQTIQKIVDESGCVRVRLDNPLNPGLLFKHIHCSGTNRRKTRIFTENLFNIGEFP